VQRHPLCESTFGGLAADALAVLDLFGEVEGSAVGDISFMPEYTKFIVINVIALNLNIVNHTY
jgi:hypothetical protein